MAAAPHPQRAIIRNPVRRHLNTVRDMKEAFERFDYKEDDVLPRREQVKMFRMIEVRAWRTSESRCADARVRRMR